MVSAPACRQLATGIESRPGLLAEHQLDPLLNKILDPESYGSAKPPRKINIYGSPILVLG
jgi:hypothetical protein